MTNENYYAILMAGGVGSRFWPVSRAAYPKQFHDMLGTGKSLLQSTFDRLQKTIPNQNIFIFTNESYDSLVQEQLPSVEKRQIVLEPAMRNTAPCILLAALKIYKENPKALIVVAPSDHWIEDEKSFSYNLISSFEKCSEENILMTIGVKPSFPNTGYGYIQSENVTSKIKRVKQFTEKPDFITAKKFLAQGNYSWNAGIFIWSASSIIEAFKNHQPELFQLFNKGVEVYNTTEEKAFIEENYPKAESISIDYAVLELANNIYTIEADFDWTDLGTWGSLYEELPKNEAGNVVVNTSRLIEISSSNNIIRTNKNKLVVLEGVSDYIIVETDDALVIVPKEKEQQIKDIRANAVEKFGNQFS